MSIKKEPFVLATLKLYPDMEKEVDRIQKEENRPSRSNTLENILLHGVQKKREERHQPRTAGHV